MNPEVITAIIAVVGGITASAVAWAKFKTKFSEIRKFIDTLDDALYDNKVTEKEYQEIWESFKAIIDPKKEEIQIG